MYMLVPIGLETMADPKVISPEIVKSLPSRFPPALNEISRCAHYYIPFHNRVRTKDGLP
jgi:hypothetical protein